MVGACSREEAPRPAAAGAGYETLELRYHGNDGIITPAELAEDLGYYEMFGELTAGSDVMRKGFI